MRAPGYMAARVAEGAEAIWDRDRTRLLRRGWRPAHRLGPFEVLLSGRLEAVQVHRAHVRIGGWMGDRPISDIVGRSRTDPGLARSLLSEGWGTGLTLWHGDDTHLWGVRDAAGSLDVLAWSREGVSIIASSIPEEMVELLPADLAIDEEALAVMVQAPEQAAVAAPLLGVTTVLPGAVVRAGRAIESEVIWSPASICRGRTWDDDPKALRRIVREATSGLLRGHDRVVGEISGGFDSAVVAASAAGAGVDLSWVHYGTEAPEGDERAYAMAVAQRHDLRLEIEPLAEHALRFDDLVAAADGPRPALQGTDPAYESAAVRRLAEVGASGWLTGQGGDAVFFQAADPRLAADHLRRRGWRGPELTFLAGLGRWTRRSVWSLLADARKRSPRTASVAPHPWLTEIDDLPPAKAGQLRRFVNAQLFWGDCPRARAGALLHPLLSPPVVAHLLAIPADRLVRAEAPDDVRDRGLARRAFAGDLPAMVLQRRSKGDLSAHYARRVSASLSELGTALLAGRMVQIGALSLQDVRRRLEPQVVLTEPGAAQLLVWAAVEAWVTRWSNRKAPIEEVEDPGVQIDQIGR